MSQVRTNIFLPEEQRDWLKDQAGSMAETVRAAIEFYREYHDVVDSFRKVDPAFLESALDDFRGKEMDGLNEVIERDEIPPDLLQADRRMMVVKLIMLDALAEEKDVAGKKE